MKKIPASYYYEKKSRPKSILPNPWNIVPNKTIVIERCLL